MELIIRTAGQGKTTEIRAVAFEAAVEAPVLVVDTENSTASWDAYAEAHQAALKISHRFPTAIIPSTGTDEEIIAQVKTHLEIGMGGVPYGLLVLDVNFAVTRAQWTNLIVWAEKRGVSVIATQQIVRTH